MQGPLTKVGTLVEGINLDISRKLNWGKGLILEFIVVDRLQLSGWRILSTRTKGFDRVIPEDATSGDGSEVIIEVADRKGTLGPILRTKDLHIRVDDIIYAVSKIPPIASNQAQVFTLKCKIRTLRTTFDSTKK